METWVDFVNVHTCKETLTTFHKLKDELGLLDTPFYDFTDQLSAKLNRWKEKQMLQRLRKKISPRQHEKVLVVGCGPCGLRTAIEAAFLGYNVVVIDKRTAFTRNNVLHLWPFLVTDLRGLEMKYFYGIFGCGELYHISIRRLQISLLKIALVLGIEVYTGVEFEGIIQPENGRSWRAVCKPINHVVSNFEFDVLISATGARDALADLTIFDSKRQIIGKKNAFDRKELRGRLAIAITANFVNSNTKEEIKAEEVGGVASHFRQDFFRELKRKTKIDLENIVYYKDETHYFVMTAKKSSLLERGVFKSDFSDAQDLMSKSNIHVPALLSYARDAANFCTKNVMPNLKFALNQYGKEDVSMLDFSSKYEAVNASRVIVRNGRPILIGLVGDSLLEPFWPTGSGCARGFLGAMDAAWMMKRWAADKANPLGLVMERECIYKLLSQTTSDNLKKKYSEFTVDPNTRYTFVNRKAVNRNQARNFCDESETKLDEYEEIEDEDVVEAPIPKTHIEVKEEDVDIKEEVLRWCKDVLGTYPNISIRNLTTSWRDGYALCALVYTFRPDLIDIKSIKRYNARSNMSFIVELAQREFGISPTMTVAEMLLCSSLNEMSMVAYLRQFYDQFADEQASTKADDTPLSPAVASILSPIEDSFEEIPEDTENIIKKPDVKSSSGVCYFCKKRLYITERICAEDIFFHQNCLKCKRCGIQLYSKKYRSRRSATGEVTFYCERHSNPKLNFASSVRKISAVRGFASGLSQPDKVTGKKPPVPPKPNLPRRPDFLSRRVTSASRRIEFYNAADEPEPEEKAEDKVFEHNFGASIRKGIGAFTIRRIKQMATKEPEEPSSSSSEDESTDEDDEVKEAIEDKFGANVDKNMTIKDAKSFLEAFRVKCKEWEDESNETPSRSSTESSDTETSNEDFSLASSKPDTEIAHRESKKRKNMERFSAGLEELEKEQKDMLKDKASTRAWMTMYRPSIDTAEPSHHIKPEIKKRPELKRQLSDPSIARRAQRIQFHARKLARENEQNRLFEAQELQRQLEEAEVRRQEIERRGIQIERQLEESTGENVKEESSLRKELFTLSVRRQELLKYESDLHSFRSQFEELEKFDELPEQPSLTLDDVNEELNKLNDEDEIEDLEKTLIQTNIELVMDKYSKEEAMGEGDVRFEETIRGGQKVSRDGEICQDADAHKMYNVAQRDNQSDTDDDDDDLVKTIRGSSNHECTDNSREVTRPDCPSQVDGDKVKINSDSDMEVKTTNNECSPNRDRIINDVHVSPSYVPEQATCDMATAQLQDMLNKIDMREGGERGNEDGGAMGNSRAEEDILEDEGVDSVQEVITTAPGAWECAYCTLLNKEEWSYCEACEAWRCIMCTFINEYRRKKCDMCYSQRPARESRHVTLNHQSEDSYV